MCFRWRCGGTRYRSSGNSVFLCRGAPAEGRACPRRPEAWPRVPGMPGPGPQRPRRLLLRQSKQLPCAECYGSFALSLTSSQGEGTRGQPEQEWKPKGPPELLSSDYLSSPLVRECSMRWVPQSSGAEHTCTLPSDLINWTRWKLASRRRISTGYCEDLRIHSLRCTCAWLKPAFTIVATRAFAKPFGLWSVLFRPGAVACRRSVG